MDFTINREEGQLWLADRKWLFDTVRELKPAQAVETGTWKGGGSTFFIASALHYNDYGVLTTVENNEEMHRYAKELYATRWSFLLPRVKFVLGDSVEELPKHLPKVALDFVFLDGDQDTEKTRAEFLLLAPMLRVGGVLMAHDWFNGKAEAIKPLLENSTCWKLETIGDPTAHGTFDDGTVGMAKATKLC